MSHVFCRTAQGRLPKPMSLKGKTTFSSKKEAQTASFFSDSKLRVILPNKKGWKSICYFFNFEFACYFTFLGS